MTLHDKDLEDIIKDAAKKPESGLNASDASQHKDVSAAHHQQDPIAAVRQEIAAHEEADRSRSLLGKAASFFYSKDQDSLSRLKQLTSDYDKAVGKGDNQTAAKIQQDLSNNLDEDRRYSAMKEDIAHYGSSFVKTAALFTKGEVGLVTTAASYALDQINSKNSDHWAVDGTLGLGKGLATRGVFELLGNSQLGAVNKGMLLGLGNRLSDLALTRQTWDGGLGSGTSKILGGMGNMENLATDGIVFGLAHALGFAGTKAAGSLEKSPVLSSMFTASTFGLLSGSAAEVNRQRDLEQKSFGTFDYAKIVKAGFAEAAVDGLAGAPGGLQAGAAGRAPSEFRAAAEVRASSLSERMNGNKIGPASLAFTDVALRLNPADGSLDRTAAAHPSEFAAESSKTQSGSGIAKLWWPERDIYKLDTEQRYELLQHIRTPLFQETPINDFSRRVLDVTRNWTDLSDVHARSKSLKDTYTKAVEHVQQMVNNEDIPYHLAGRMHEHELVEAELADKPSHLAKYRQYVAAREAYAKSTENTRELLDQRAAQVEEAINGFARESGLPPVRLRHSEDLGSAAASYDVGKGVMTVRDARLLNGESAADLIGSAYHELVHSEQDTLVIRNAADELGVGKLATAEQITQIQKKLVETAKTNADADRIAQVMKLRAGVPLTAEEKERAEALTEGFRINSRVDYKDSGDDFRMTARELNRLEEMNSAYILTDKLLGTGGGKLSSHLFGSPTPPPEVQGFMKLLEQFHEGSDVEWNSAALKQRYKQLFTDRLNEINQFRQKQYEAYMAGEHEKEAWGVGERARFLAAHMIAITGGAKVTPIEQGKVIPSPLLYDDQQQSSLGIAADARRAAIDVAGPDSQDNGS